MHLRCGGRWKRLELLGLFTNTEGDFAAGAEYAFIRSDIVKTGAMNNEVLEARDPQRWLLHITGDLVIWRRRWGRETVVLRHST